MNIRSDTINDLQWRDIVVGTRSPTVGSETVPCFREDGEQGTVTGGLGFQCRRLLKGTGVSPSATRGTGWVRGDLGLAGPYLSLPESPARACPPSHSSVQREDSAV